MSDDGHLLAYSLDTTGFREYTLYVKDLRSGALLSDRIERVSSAAWAADSATLYHVTEDDAKRAYRLWRHRLGDPDDTLLWEEPDELFRLGVGARALALLSAPRATSHPGIVRPAQTRENGMLPRGARPRVRGDHGADFLHPHQCGRPQFPLVTRPGERARGWTEISPTARVMLEEVQY